MRREREENLCFGGNYKNVLYCGWIENSMTHALSELELECTHHSWIPNNKPSTPDTAGIDI